MKKEKLWTFIAGIEFFIIICLIFVIIENRCPDCNCAEQKPIACIDNCAVCIDKECVCEEVDCVKEIVTDITQAEDNKRILKELI